jgi:hypothetical protein
MSISKFASITSSLFARKGEARPWEEPETTVGERWLEEFPSVENSLPNLRASREWPLPAPQIGLQTFNSPSTPTFPLNAMSGNGKKCAVRMSPKDYDRIGIVAKTNGVKRQQLLQEAVQQYIARRANECQSICPCLRDTLA